MAVTPQQTSARIAGVAPTPPQANLPAAERLTEMEGRPDYSKLYNARQELCKNALAVKCFFGGDNYGTLGIVLEDVVYQAETVVAWNVPASQGAYPIFQRRATKTQKKTAISEFIQDETDIKKVSVVEEL